MFLKAPLKHLLEYLDINEFVQVFLKRVFADEFEDERPSSGSLYLLSNQ